MFKSFAVNSGPSTPTLSTVVDRPISVKMVMGTFLNTLLMWQSRSNERRHLASLDRRLLQDVGLTADAIQQEIAKPFWRP